MGKVVPLFCRLLTTHTSSGASNVWRYAVGSYCLDSQADLHSSTSRLYISTASSMSTYSHLMCDIISSVFNSLAGFILYLKSADSWSWSFWTYGRQNCVYGWGLLFCQFFLASINWSIQATNSLSESCVGFTMICV